jgi:hypothetical protein
MSSLEYKEGFIKGRDSWEFLISLSLLNFSPNIPYHFQTRIRAGVIPLKLQDSQICRLPQTLGRSLT